MSRILNISYDAALLRTREELLKREGFDVMSVVGLADAIQAIKNCQYNLAIIGHSIPREDKRKLVYEIKSCAAHVPVLSLRRHDTAPLPEADFSLNAFEGPAALVAMVRKIFGSQRTDQKNI